MSDSYRSHSNDGGNGTGGSGNGAGGHGGPEYSRYSLTAVHSTANGLITEQGVYTQMGALQSHLSYPQNAVHGGGSYYQTDNDLVDGMGSAGTDKGNGSMAVRVVEPLGWRLLRMLQQLWLGLVGAFRSVHSRCLRCVGLLTSSDDDPGDVDAWARTDSTVVGAAVGHPKSMGAGAKAQDTKGVLVDMGYYEFMSVDYNGQGPVAHPVHLMQVGREVTQPGRNAGIGP